VRSAAIELIVSDEPSTLLVCARISPGREEAFGQWQVGWQTAALAAGALSVELWPAAPPDQLETVVTARFPSIERLQQWRRGDAHRKLIDQVTPLVAGGLVFQLVGQAAVDYAVRHGVTMVMVTDIKPGKEAAYRAWADRIQKLQASFPGYIGSFVQPPEANQTGWTTLLRFDSAAHLDNWLKSDARAAMVKESEDLVQDSHAQRVDTAFPGWVPTDPATGKPPNRWKTASLILLTLFPVVMLELRFLNPHLHGLNPAVGTFIGNVISVALTTWPLIPLAVWAFHPWLFPEKQPRWLVATMPLLLVLAYLIEIALLWNLMG
jgi:antibiotic biosynthesis monooxygenase (ABM) superfamily enzyme